MRALRGVVAALALSCAVVTGAGEPRLTGYKSYVLPTYTLITPEKYAAQHLPAEVTKVDTLLATLFNRVTHHPGIPTYIVVVPHDVWKRYLEPGRVISGEFLPGHFANYLLFDRSNLNDSRYDGVYHEYTHFYLWTQVRGVHPLWFDEGFAELLQFTNFAASSAEFRLPGYPPQSFLPMSRLLRIDKTSPEYRDRAITHSVHFQSWALIHRGVIANREFGLQLFAFLAALNEMQPIDRAVRSSFGMDVEQLDASMRSYMSKFTFDTARINLNFPAPPIPPPGRDMSELETLEFLAEIQLVSGFKPERFAEVVEAARRRAPESIRVHALRMRLAARDRDDAAFQRLFMEIEPRISDAATARSIGLALYERVRLPEPSTAGTVIDSAAMSQRALDLLQLALAGQPNDVETVCAYATLAARLEENVPDALARVENMRGKLPSNGDLAMAAAALYEARNEPQAMTPYLVDIVRFSNWDEQRKWAALRLGRN